MQSPEGWSKEKVLRNRTENDSKVQIITASEDMCTKPVFLRPKSGRRQGKKCGYYEQIL